MSRTLNEVNVMKNNQQSTEQSESVVSLSWLQVLAFGGVVDTVEDKNRVAKSTTIFEVMP